MCLKVPHKRGKRQAIANFDREFSLFRIEDVAKLKSRLPVMVETARSKSKCLS